MPNQDYNSIYTKHNVSTSDHKEWAPPFVPISSFSENNSLSKREIPEFDPAILKEVISSIKGDVIASRQAYKESGFRPTIISQKGAQGLFQIMPNVKKEYEELTKETVDLNNPADSLKVRNWVWNRLDKSNTTRANTPEIKTAKKLAAYNWGLGNLGRVLEKAKAEGIDIYNTLDWMSYLPKETSDYIKYILLGEDVGKTTQEAYNREIGRYQSPWGPLPGAQTMPSLIGVPDWDKQIKNMGDISFISHEPSKPWDIAPEYQKEKDELVVLNQNLENGEIHPFTWPYLASKIYNKVKLAEEVDPDAAKRYYSYKADKIKQAVDYINKQHYNTFYNYYRNKYAKNPVEIGPMPSQFEEWARDDYQWSLNLPKKVGANILNQRLGVNLSAEDWDQIRNFYTSSHPSSKASTSYRASRAGMPLTSTDQHTIETLDRQSDPRYAELKKKYPEVISLYEKQIDQRNSNLEFRDGLISSAVLANLAGAYLLPGVTSRAGAYVASRVPGRIGQALGTVVANPITTAFTTLEATRAGKNFAKGDTGEGLFHSAFAVLPVVGKYGKFIKSPWINLKERPTAVLTSGAPVGKTFYTPLGVYGRSSYMDAWSPNLLGKAAGYSLENPMPIVGAGLIGKGILDEDLSPAGKALNIGVGTLFSANALKYLK